MADALTLDLSDPIKFANGIAALREKSLLVDQLQEENTRLRHQVEDVPIGWAELLDDNHFKQARIDALEKQLKNAQMKIQKWRQRYALSSPPAGSDGIAPSTTIDDQRSSDGAVARVSPLGQVNTTTDYRVDRAVDRVDGRQNRQPLMDTSGNPGRPPALRKRKAGDHGAGVIPFIAEDGEDYTTVKPETRGLERDTAKLAAHRRIGDLLSEPSPSLPVLNAGTKSSATGSTSTTIGRTESPRTSSPKIKGRMPDMPRTAGSSLPSKPRTSPEAEDEEPFRSRPLHRLSLAHFRLNSNASASLNYAYLDIFRDRQQRKCLSGCTRPDCCGSVFSALASSSNLGISDDDLLKDTSGSDAEEQIKTITTSARKEVMVEARMKKAADLYGKHRNAHERARSPVGFWTTEMPGTQEEQENRKQARLRERQEVERRYDGALKEGGRWIFADR